MMSNYETLDEYLDALDGIKEKVAEETEGMSAQQVKDYFAAAAQSLQKATGQTVRVRNDKRKRSTAKR